LYVAQVRLEACTQTVGTVRRFHVVIVSGRPTRRHPLLPLVERDGWSR